MSEKRGHMVKEAVVGSIAEEMGIAAGDRLLQVNGTDIEDIFDYQYLIQDDYIEVLVAKPDGEEWLLEIEKDPEEDLGIVFENGLMDDYRHCHNKCIFCFIDQMPPGMRDTLYFKDDDSRLSFLQGNYVTLTNMSEHDVDRIIKYHLSPINISFQTMNPELRCRMLNNRFAGDSLKKVDRLMEAGITMNGQIVLCKGINDGEELEFSIRELMKYLPNLESVSVVPVGLTKYREGLYPLEPFGKEDARKVLETIHGYQKECMAKYGTHFIHASDEWYLLAEEELPEEERYDGYLQLENGVGMLRLLMEEFEEAFREAEKTFPRAGTSSREAEKFFIEGAAPSQRAGETCSMEDAQPSQDAEASLRNGQESCPEFRVKSRVVSLATGMLAYPCIKAMMERLEKRFLGLTVLVYAIRNDFFGESITVSGLLTGQDIRNQLQGRPLGECLLLPQNLLRSGEDVFLDDLHVPDLERSLQVPINIVKSSGRDLIEAVLGRKIGR